MKTRIVVSMAAALTVFFALSMLFSGKPDNAGVLASIDPANAVMGLSFLLSFGAGVPTIVSITVAIAAFVLIPAAVFWLVQRLFQRYNK